MSDHDRPGAGARPGIEDQPTQAATGKPAQVPGTTGGDGPNADAFDASAETQALRPEPGEGPLDPRHQADDLLERE